MYPWLSLILINLYRTIYLNGDIHEGEYNLGSKHGMGKMTFYEDGRTEEGNWVKDIYGGHAEGEFECIYKDGTVEKKYY